ncbi:MAG TPA: FG-GAP repeat protein [Steroidobacteraceae bacterium]
MINVSVRCWIAASVLALGVVPLAQAELPQLNPVQMLAPNDSDATDDPNLPPSPPFFGAGLALQGNVALAGMPGAFDDKGRVAALVRNASGKWVRFQTLTASNATAGADFGEHIAICNMCALITSHTAVYIFRLQSGKWSAAGQLPFGRAVQVRDLDVQGNTVAVGASDSTGDAVYAFRLNTNGTFRRITRFAAPDAVSSDRFGERVAVYGSTVAVTAPGYNAGQGAAYVYTCTDTQCVQRQKLLANDGTRGDGFGQAVDLANGILVVGAPSADWVPGNPDLAPSEQNHRAGGSAYLFVRKGTTWIEQQKLHPGARQLNWYASFGLQVRVSATHVVIGAPYQVDEWEPGYVVDYRWSGGSLFAAHMMVNEISHGDALALSGNTLFAGIPDAPPYWGEAAVYNLGAP